MVDVIIIGGGLSGLINAVLLKKSGLSVTLFEEKKYPFHRVCGEYISNEVIPFLESQNLFPSELLPSNITQLQLTSPSGNALNMKLDLGGFGISRYNYDLWLSKKAKEAGVIIIHERVISCDFESDEFHISTNSEDRYRSKIVIGAFGKRSLLDKKLDRSFTNKRSPYIGVKYHIKNETLAQNKIALHNFENGYCGVSKVENDTFNLCYLSHRSNLKAHSNIPAMEEAILKKNPFLKTIFNDSIFLFEKPEVINEISFKKKEPVFKHLLMSGDSAGMITPLCGNGMAMAIHSAKMLSELIIKHLSVNFERNKLEEEYTTYWETQFSKRLWAGRKIQSLFGAKNVSEFAVFFGKNIPSFTHYLMSKTHGGPF